MARAMSEAVTILWLHKSKNAAQIIAFAHVATLIAFAHVATLVFDTLLDTEDSKHVSM